MLKGRNVGTRYSTNKTMENERKLSGKITLNFGWDAYPRQYSGGLISGLLNRNDPSVDCDASAIFCGQNGRLIAKEAAQCCVNYSNLSMFDSAVVHSGDNQTGDRLYDEVITMDLDRIPSSVGVILLALDIFKEKKKVYGKIQHAFLKVKDADTGSDIDTNNIVGLGGGTKLVIAGKLCRAGDGWIFKRAPDCHSVDSMSQFFTTLP